MSKKEKLLKRIKQKPRDFTYTELETLLINFLSVYNIEDDVSKYIFSLILININQYTIFLGRLS